MLWLMDPFPYVSTEKRLSGTCLSVNIVSERVSQSLRPNLPDSHVLVRFYVVRFKEAVLTDSDSISAFRHLKDGEPSLATLCQ